MRAKLLRNAVRAFDNRHCSAYLWLKSRKLQVIIKKTTEVAYEYRKTYE